MELKLDEIRNSSDPYQSFLDSLKNKHTYRKYKNALNDFLKLVPSKIYEEELKKNPEDREPKTLARYFVELTRKNPDIVTKVLIQFVKKEVELVQNGKLSPNTIPNHIKPIKALLDSNGVAIPWKSIYKLYPRANQAAEDRAYTRKELQKMIEASPDITDKIIVQMFSSGGFRLEAWNYFTWKDVQFFQNKDGSFKGAALLVYRGDPESYWTFLTPECCQTLANYREIWKSQIGRYPKDDEPLLKAVKYPTIRRLNAFGIKKRLQNIVSTIGLRPPLPPGKRRHEVQLAHGFRKYFNTMMRRAKVSYLDKEDMMGHQVGLERHYERYQEEDFERFPEYQKAIPFLTISDEERLRLENMKLEGERSETENARLEIEKLKNDLKKTQSYNVSTIEEMRKVISGLAEKLETAKFVTKNIYETYTNMIPSSKTTNDQNLVKKPKRS